MFRKKVDAIVDLSTFPAILLANGHQIRAFYASKKA